MQFVPGDTHIGPLRRQLAPCLAQHALPKAVILAHQVHRLERRIFAQQLHQSRHAHVGMGVESEMPKTAFFIGQRGVHGRVVQKKYAPGRIAGVVLVDSVNQGGRHRRRIALQNNPRPAVDGQTQGRQRLLCLPLAVKALQHQRHRSFAPRHAAPRIDALYGPDQIAVYRLATTGVRPAQALDQSQLDWPLRRLRLC